jgi:hypothetical protein
VENPEEKVEVEVVDEAGKNLITNTPSAEAAVCIWLTKKIICMLLI